MFKSVDVCEIKIMDLFNKVQVFEPMKSHIYEPNISLMVNSTKSRIVFLVYLNGCPICLILPCGVHLTI